MRPAKKMSNRLRHGQRTSQGRQLSLAAFLELAL
jgi:hypothetical protein